MLTLTCMNLNTLKTILCSNGAQKIFVKSLAPNDNSKNQVYLGGSFDLLNIFPVSEIKTEDPGDWKRQRFKAEIQFYWITDEGIASHAPYSQLILYPKYPEVRFSGFLKNAEYAPSTLMASRDSGRLLFLAPASNKILGFVTSADSELAMEFKSLGSLKNQGVFNVIEIDNESENRIQLINDLRKIHLANWIDSWRLDKFGFKHECNAPNCGGYTLEAELNVRPNGFAEPDYLGWEIKQFGVKDFNKDIKSEVITLMTPEPDGGKYCTMGVDTFIREYGYIDRKKSDRMNFGGVYKNASVPHHNTGLSLQVDGYDFLRNSITNVNGSIALVDKKMNIAASWSFIDLLKHWNKKHHLACYVPSNSRKNPKLQYRYGRKVIMGTGTDFILFLNQIHQGNIYYDPGIKLENFSTTPKIKRRSQFRIKAGYLKNLYYKTEIVDLLGI